MKITHRIASLALALILSISSTGPVINASGRQLKIGIGFVNASSLRLRSEASTAGKTLDFASRNEVVVLLGKTGNWYKVNYNLKTGYMHQDYLNCTTRENVELGYGSINGDNVNVRSGPGTMHSVLATADSTDKAYIIGMNNQWVKLIFGKDIGYVRSDYVDLTEIPYENNDSPKSPLFFVGGESTGIKPDADVLNGFADTTQDPDIVATSKKYIGVPYLWGGTSTDGFDCSGYVQYVFNENGITLPRTSREQYTAGYSVSRSDLKSGDLVFFNTSGNGVSHVGIYLGNGQFIHASSSRGVVIASLDGSYWSSRYLGAQRVY